MVQCRPQGNLRRDMPAENIADQYPERRVSDTVADMAKALFGSAVRGAGALAAAIQASHARRLEAFHRRTGDRVHALEQTTAPTLLQRATDGDEDAREESLSTYTKISRLVQESMDNEKREALAMAMASSLMSPEGQEVERRHFLRCLADFETIHIQLIVRAGQRVRAVRELVLPTVVKDPRMLGDNAKPALLKINDRGLVNVDLQSVNTMMTSSGMTDDRRTLMGTRFLAFIGRDD